MNRLPLHMIVLLVICFFVFNFGFSFPGRPFYCGQWGSYGTGLGQFSYPMDISSFFGYVYIADTQNNRIKRSHEDGSYVYIIEHNFNHPEGVDYHYSGLWVCDTGNNCIQKFTTYDQYIKTFGSFGSGQGQFNHPTDIKGCNDQIYVVDQGNNRIQVFNSSDFSFIRQWGTYGTGQGQFNNPTQLCLSDHVFVTDTGNNRIQAFDYNGNYLYSWGTLGSGPGQFNHPTGITDYSFLNLIFVTDQFNNRISIYEESGLFMSNIGELGTGPERFNNPCGISYTNDEGYPIYLHVLEYNNNRVQYWRITYSEVQPTSLGNLKALYH